MATNVVIITGTPGTGKTTIANKIQSAGYLTINLFEFAEKNNCLDGFDEERGSMIVDTDKLEFILENYLKTGSDCIIIEGHYTDIIPNQFVKKIFVLSAELGALRVRLKERNYPEDKIDENLEAEIMQVCWTDSLEAFGSSKVIKIENSDITETTNLIINYLKTNFDNDQT